MAQPIEQSRPVLPLRSAKAGIWSVVARKMHARALDLPFKTGQNQFFWAGQNGQMDSDLRKLDSRDKKIPYN